jgi:hypothetical protein
MPEPTQIKTHCVFERMVPLTELRPHPRNPKKHPADQIRMLAKIVKHQGWRGCIVVSNRSGFIVEGHGRLEAARMLGVVEVPVDFQDFESEEDEIAHLIADNTIAEFGDMNDKQLDSLIKRLEEANVDLELAGILKGDDEEEINNAQYPITAKLHEQYDYVVIFTDNATDFIFLQTLCGVQQESSYKKSGIGIGRCIPFTKFLKAIRENHHSINVPVGNDDNASAPR